MWGVSQTLRVQRRNYDRALGPKYYSDYRISALKPNYFSPWTLREERCILLLGGRGEVACRKMLGIARATMGNRGC